jgi:hypothetical protein
VKTERIASSRQSKANLGRKGSARSAGSVSLWIRCRPKGRAFVGRHAAAAGSESAAMLADRQGCKRSASRTQRLELERLRSVSSLSRRRPVRNAFVVVVQRRRGNAASLLLSRLSAAATLPSVRPNPSLHPKCYSGLRPLPHSGELKR